MVSSGHTIVSVKYQCERRMSLWAHRRANCYSHFIRYSYFAKWSMMDDYHPDKCRQRRVVVMPHLAAYMWLMIKVDKWLTVLNCPLIVWCLLECDTLPLAPFREGPHHSIFSPLFPCVYMWVCILCVFLGVYKWNHSVADFCGSEICSRGRGAFLHTLSSIATSHECLTYNTLLAQLSHMLCYSCLINVVDASCILYHQLQWVKPGLFPMPSDGSLCYQWGDLSPIT